MRTLLVGTAVAATGLLASALVSRSSYSNEELCLNARQDLENISKRLELVQDEEERENFAQAIGSLVEELENWLNQPFVQKIYGPDLRKVKELCDKITTATQNDDLESSADDADE